MKQSVRRRPAPVAVAAPGENEVIPDSVLKIGWLNREP